LPEPVAPVLLFDCAEELPLCAEDAPDWFDAAPELFELREIIEPALQP
jgi:hypothetical protein